MSVPTAPRAPARERSGRDTAAWVALLLAVAVLAGGLFAVLSHAEPRRAGTNGTYADNEVLAPAGTTVCQPGEIVPAGTRSLRLSLSAPPGGGPRVAVELRGGGRRLGQGTLGPGWTGAAATVPLRAEVRDLVSAEVCVRAVGGPVGLVTGPTPPGGAQATAGGEPIGAALSIDYLRAGAQSWWAFAPEVFRRIGAAHGGRSGTAVAAAVLGCLAAAWALAAIVLVRTVVRAGAWRATALAVAAVGALNAAAWSVITPPFFVPDEITHFAYAQQIGETGRPPVETARPRYSLELQTAMRDTFADETIPQYAIAAWVPQAAQRLAFDQAQRLPRVGDGSAKASNPEPPLYYALAAVPYVVAKDASLLDRLGLMRLLGALLAGATALLAFLFAREVLPAQPWASGIGALVVAFAPMVGWVSGGVNPDALLFAVCAALFYLLARAFRRGLTPALAAWIGVVVALGMVGKINFYGLVPGALLAVALAARATAGGWNARALRLGGIVLAVGFGPYLLMHVLDAVVWDRGNILWKDTSEASDDHGGLLGQLAYLWQVYLPPLPGQDAELPVTYIGYDLWFRTWFGAFLGNVVFFASWAYLAALGVVLALVALAVRAGVAARAEVRRRLPELVGYAAMVAGLLLLIGAVAVRGWAPDLAAAAQGRYLLPLMALFAGVVALGVRGAGSRWGRTLGAVLVVAAVAWSLFGQLHVIAHFYG